MDVVFWTLSDARYPVAAETPEGDIRSLRRLRITRAVQRTDHVLELIERLRLGSETAPEDHPRQLDAAIRSKAAITVTVMMPNGSTVNYQLEAHEPLRADGCGARIGAPTSNAPCRSRRSWASVLPSNAHQVRGLS